MTYEPTDKELKEMEDSLVIPVEITESEKIGTYATAMSKSRTEFGELAQSGKLKMSGKDIPYSTLKDIYRSTLQALHDNGLSILTQVNLTGTTAEITVKIIHSESEQWIKSVLSTPVAKGSYSSFLQEFGKTKTYLIRNALEGMLLIPSYGEEDEIAEQHGDTPRKRQPVKAKKKEELASAEIINDITELLARGFNLLPLEITAKLKEKYGKSTLQELTQIEAAAYKMNLINDQKKDIR